MGIVRAEQPTDSGGYEDVAAFASIRDGGNRAFDVGPHDVLLCRVGPRVYAVRNRCSHAFAALEGGEMDGAVLTCPLHGARFDVSTGRAMGGGHPALATFEIRLVAGRVLVRLPPE